MICLDFLRLWVPLVSDDERHWCRLTEHCQTLSAESESELSEMKWNCAISWNMARLRMCWVTNAIYEVSSKYRCLWGGTFMILCTCQMAKKRWPPWPAQVWLQSLCLQEKEPTDARGHGVALVTHPFPINSNNKCIIQDVQTPNGRFQCQAGLRGAIAPKNLGVWEPRPPRRLLKGRLGCWMSLRYLAVRYMGGSVVHIPPVQQWIWRWEIVVPTTTATGLEMGEIGKLWGLWVGEWHVNTTSEVIRSSSRWSLTDIAWIGVPAGKYGILVWRFVVFCFGFFGIYWDLFVWRPALHRHCVVS